MELHQYPAEIAELRSQVLQTEQQISSTKAELQRQLENSAELKNLQNHKERLYIQLEKTRQEFSIQKLEFIKRDRQLQAE